MVDMSFSTKEKFEKHGIGKYETTVCFYGEGEKPLDIKGEGEYICARLDDLSYFEIKEKYGGYYPYKFFPDADRVADMVIRAAAEGKDIVFQEDTRGASCAAAVLEFFTGGGMQIFGKHRLRRNDYGLNTEIYEILYGTLCCMKPLMDDIGFDKLRTGRAAVSRQESISRLYDLMCGEYAVMKAGEEEYKKEGDTDEKPTLTSEGLYISEVKRYRCGEINNEVFAFKIITSDKVLHYYCGCFDAPVLEAFLNKYNKEDIEYIGVEFRHENNDFGVNFTDSECGDSFTDEHLITYFQIINDKYGVKEEDIYD